MLAMNFWGAYPAQLCSLVELTQGIREKSSKVRRVASEGITVIPERSAFESNHRPSRPVIVRAKA
jgi:hypothetical protein